MPTSAPASTASLSVASPLAALGAQVRQHQDTETDSGVLMQLCSLIPRMGPPWWVDPSGGQQVADETLQFLAAKMTKKMRHTADISATDKLIVALAESNSIAACAEEAAAQRHHDMVQMMGQILRISHPTRLICWKPQRQLLLLLSQHLHQYLSWCDSPLSSTIPSFVEMHISDSYSWILRSVNVKMNSQMSHFTGIPWRQKFYCYDGQKRVNNHEKVSESN